MTRHLEEWAKRVAAYQLNGTETYVMMHCPNNLHCPPLALDFHRTLTRKDGMVELSYLDSWPLPEQLSLM